MLIIVPVHECADQIDINDGKNDDDNNLQGGNEAGDSTVQEKVVVHNKTFDTIILFPKI